MKLYSFFTTLLLFSLNVCAGKEIIMNEETRLIQYAYSDSPSHSGKLIERNYVLFKEKKDSHQHEHDISIIGAHLVPFSTIRQTTKLDGKIAYDLSYDTGEFGLRVIPEYYYAKNPKIHIITAGDSNTFGEGVTLESTLAMQLAKKFPESHPYNFGIRGGGPHNTLAFMEFFPWEKLIKEKNGIFIYNYYDFLLERVIGFRHVMEWTMGEDPFYYINEEGEAVYDGPFKYRPLNIFFLLINRSEFLRKLFPVLPKPGPHHDIVVAKIFLKMFKLYKSKFPNGHFYVVLNHYAIARDDRFQNLANELQVNNVPFIALPKDQPYSPAMFSVDSHVNALGQKFTADLIFKGLPQNLFKNLFSSQNNLPNTHTDH